MFSFRTTRLEDQLDRALLDGRVGCLCTQNSWDTDRGRYMYELFKERGNLEKLFMPKGAELCPTTNHIVFDKEELLGLQAVVVEIQDVGSRYFNYTKDVFKLMVYISQMGDNAPALYIVDHLNPAGRIVEGTMPCAAIEPFVPKVAHRHGLSLGELCYLYYNEIGAKFPLHIISALATNANKLLLPWTIAPASDIPGMFTCYMYSGGGLWNNTSITPAIGTARPYEYIGAPFIVHSNIDVLPAPEGVLIRPCTFTPSTGAYMGDVCRGYQILLHTGYEYHSLIHTLTLLRYFKERYSQFELYQDFYKKISDNTLVDYILGNIDYITMREYIKVEEQKWIRKAKRYCLYDDMPIRIK